MWEISKFTRGICFLWSFDFISVGNFISLVSLQKEFYFKDFAYLLLVAEVRLDVWQN